MKQVVQAFGRLNLGTRMYPVFVLFAASAISLPAQIFTTLHNFEYNTYAGANPDAGLVPGIDGNLYGTAQTGGGPNGLGTVFKITPSGIVTTLHIFSGPDGAAPEAGLVLSHGEIYGTTYEGGTGSGANNCVLGCGTIFKIASDGTLTTLHNFDGMDGLGPFALLQAGNGEFYGITRLGGADFSRGVVIGSGTVFKMAPGGTLTTLHSFCSQAGCGDGENPTGLIQAKDGSFYGTTSNAGDGAFCVPSSGEGCGTIFKITPSGALTMLYSFCSQPNCADGAVPAGLVQGIDGDLYGTTVGGGGVLNSFPCFDGCGTVYKITCGGALTTLYSFSGTTDGERPEGAPIQATDGNFYGTTSGTDIDGVFGGGTIFKITPAGRLTTLRDLNNSTDGSLATGALVQDRDGSFYGTAMNGGSDNAGTVFGLALFVNVAPGFGEVGSTVEILGTNLAEATSVTFNGTAAAFEVVSPTEILAILPPGASTGEVEVVTAGGTLFSNMPFRVL